MDDALAAENMKGKTNKTITIEYNDKTEGRVGRTAKQNEDQDRKVKKKG